MSNYDQQISDNIKQLEAINKKISDLATALKVVSQNSTKTYGLSSGFKPKRGIYYIEDGWIKSLAELDNSFDFLPLDKIKDFELITDGKNEENKKLKITYANNKTIIIK